MLHKARLLSSNKGSTEILSPEVPCFLDASEKRLRQSHRRTTSHPAIGTWRGQGRERQRRGRDVRGREFSPLLDMGPKKSAFAQRTDWQIILPLRNPVSSKNRSYMAAAASVGKMDCFPGPESAWRAALYHALFLGGRTALQRAGNHAGLWHTAGTGHMPSPPAQGAQAEFRAIVPELLR